MMPMIMKHVRENFTKNKTKIYVFFSLFFDVSMRIEFIGREIVLFFVEAPLLIRRLSSMMAILSSQNHRAVQKLVWNLNGGDGGNDGGEDSL